MKKIITSILLLCFLWVNNLTYVYAEEKLTWVQKLSLFTLDKLEEETKQTIENVEKQITDYELKWKLEDKKEEINQLIKETQEEIKQEKDKEELKEILDETTKILTLKAVSWVTPTIDITQEINFQSTTSEEDKSKAKETLIKSLDNNGYYNLYLKTNLGISQIQETLLKYDSNLRIQLLFQEWWYNYYELNTSKESILREELLENIQKWEIPEDLIWIEIVKPELLKVNNEYEEEQNNQNWNNLQTNYDSDSVKISNTKNQENTQNITQENWWYKKYNISKYQSLIKEKTTNNWKKIKVWIIDTWISYNNPEISNQISKTTPWYDFVNDDNDPTDDQWHWTHVSWIIWSENNSIWITWINPNIEIVPLKICDSSWFCPSYWIYKAIDYSIENKLDVLNMSLWSKWNPLTSMICESISQASKNWIIVVTAAWNSNTDANTFIPWWCNDVITVWAVDEDLSRAWFSNYWEKVDVAAPWVWINSTYLINSYKVMNWTSMAVPHITWIVSILKTYNQNLTLNQAKEILKNNSIEVSSVEWKNIGKFVDFEKLMNSLWVSIQETTKDEIITENSLKDTNIVSNTNNTTNTWATLEWNTTNNTTKETPKTENNQNTDSNKNNWENSIKLPNNETSDSWDSNSKTNKNIWENNTKTWTWEDSIILPILEKSPEELWLVNISILDETIWTQLNQENNDNIVWGKTNWITSEVNSNYENVNNSTNNEINNTQKSEEYTSTPEEWNQIQEEQTFDLNSIFDNNIVNNNLKETSNYNDYFINNYDNYWYYDYWYYDNWYNNYENNKESYYNESQSQINQSWQEVSYEDNTSDDSLSLQATYTCDINVLWRCSYTLTNANNTSIYSYSVSTSWFISYSTTSSNLTITWTKAWSVSLFIRKYNTSTKKFDALHTVNVNVKEPVKSLTASLWNSSIQTSATTSLNITSWNWWYNVSSSNTNVASVSWSNTSWTITWKSAWDATITVKDSKTSLNLSIKVTSPAVTVKNLVLSSNSFQIDKWTYWTFSIKDWNGWYVIKTSSPNLWVYDNWVNSYKVYSTVSWTYTVQVTDSQKKSASLTISVLNPLIATNFNQSLQKYLWETVSYSVTSWNGNYTISSSNTNVATVSPNYWWTSWTITAKWVWTATITLKDWAGKVLSLNFTWKWYPITPFTNNTSDLAKFIWFTVTNDNSLWEWAIIFKISWKYKEVWVKYLNSNWMEVVEKLPINIAWEYKFSIDKNYNNDSKSAYSAFIPYFVDNNWKTVYFNSQRYLSFWWTSNLWWVWVANIWEWEQFKEEWEVFEISSAPNDEYCDYKWQKYKRPTNASCVNDVWWNAWVCNEWYTESWNSCIAQTDATQCKLWNTNKYYAKPQNATCVPWDNINAWKCNSWYEEKWNSCVKVETSNLILNKKGLRFSDIQYTQSVEEWYVWWFYFKVDNPAWVKEAWIEYYNNSSISTSNISWKSQSIQNQWDWEFAAFILSKTKYTNVRWYVKTNNGNTIYTNTYTITYWWSDLYTYYSNWNTIASLNNDWVETNLVFLAPIAAFVWSFAIQATADYFCELNWGKFYLPSTWNQNNTFNFACAISAWTTVVSVAALWKTALKMAVTKFSSKAVVDLTAKNLNKLAAEISVLWQTWKFMSWLWNWWEKVWVYIWYKWGKPVYVWISNNITRREIEHKLAKKLDYVKTIVSESVWLTKNQARAIEQNIINANKIEFDENFINSIAEWRDIYDNALEWWAKFMKANNIPVTWFKP